MIPPEIIDEVRSRVDIVAFMGRYVDLKKAGTIYKACCPFHSERSPSFTVTPARNTYHCFGCQVHGDAIKFLVEHEGRSFPEAVRELAAEVGVEVPESRRETAEQREARRRKKSQKERLLETQDKVTAYYSRALFGPTGGPARGYLQGRDITRRSAEAFRLGWADGKSSPFHDFCIAESLQRDDLVALGLLVKPDAGWSGDQPLWGGYLRFRRRLMFPVVDLRGEVTGYSGRILDANAKAAKYINSPETPLFTKGEQLYGAHTARNAARRAGRLILVEGNVDVVALWQHGLEGTAAAMGTALTPKQARLVKRLSEKVICVMDGDAAGQKAAFKSLSPFLEAGLQPRAVMLPEGADPDSFVGEFGIDAFVALVDAARPLLDLFIEKAAADHPADTPGRLEALREIAPALGVLGDDLSYALYRRQTEVALEVDGVLIDAAVAAAKADAERSRSRRARREAGALGRHGRETGKSAKRPPASPAAPTPPASPAPASVPVPPEQVSPEVPEPPSWLDMEPSGFVSGPEPAPFLDDGPFSGDSEYDSDFPPQSAPQTVVGVPGNEAEVIELFMQFPELTPRFITEGWDKCLTHPDVAAFVRVLNDEVTAGRAPNQDRLLAQIADPGVVAFLRQRQARRPWQSEETIELAFAEVMGRLMPKVALVDRRAEVIAELMTSIAAHESTTAANKNDHVVTLRTELHQIGKQLDTLAEGKN